MTLYTLSDDNWVPIGTTGGYSFEEFDAAYRESLMDRIQSTFTFTMNDVDEDVFKLMYGMSRVQAELLYRVNEHAQGRGHLLGKPNNWKGLS